MNRHAVFPNKHFSFIHRGPRVCRLCILWLNDQGHITALWNTTICWPFNYDKIPQRGSRWAIKRRTNMILHRPQALACNTEWSRSNGWRKGMLNLMDFKWKSKRLWIEIWPLVSANAGWEIPAVHQCLYCHSQCHSLAGCDVYVPHVSVCPLTHRYPLYNVTIFIAGVEGNIFRWV